MRVWVQGTGYEKLGMRVWLLGPGYQGLGRMFQIEQGYLEGKITESDTRQHEGIEGDEVR